MKIGVLTTSYPRGPEDPAGHFVRGFCEWLAAEVGDVDVLACADPGGLAAGGLPARLEGAPGALRAAAISSRLLVAARRRSPRWDALVSHWVLPCGLIGALVAEGRRHLAIAHGSDIALARALPGGEPLVRRLARRADLVYVSESLRIDGAPGRVVAMPALEDAAPRTDAERAAARAGLGLDPVGRGPLVLLFLGRLIADKGADLLLDALPDDVLLLLAGDGPDRAALADHPAVRRGQARLLGLRLGAEKRALLSAADLLVVPSRRDGSPTVLAEAREAGLPALVTRVGGLEAALGGAGWVVDPTRAAICGELRRLAHERNALCVPVPRPPGWRETGPRLWPQSPAMNLLTTGNISVIYY